MISYVWFCLGYFDQQFRQILFTQWAAHLQQAGIQFRPDLARVEVSNVSYFCYKLLHIVSDDTEICIIVFF